LTAETRYGGTVTNVKQKRVPGGGRSYSKTTRTKACGYTWDRQQTTVWWTKSTRRNVLCVRSALMPVTVSCWTVFL